jgi:hypothetical protein
MGAIMPDNSNRALPDRNPPETRSNGAPETSPKAQSNPIAGPSNEDLSSMTAPTEMLKRDVEKNRLPAGLKEQILAELPPPEEHERLYRELRDKGGLSSEEFFESLGIKVPPQP